jgi:hypothetical protein
MLNPSKEMLGLRELIDKIRQDLITPTSQDGPALFSIDEVTLQVNFVITGDIESGFNIGVVSLGSQVNEERTQTVTIKMTPLISKDDLKKLAKKSKIAKAADAVGHGAMQVGGSVSGNELISNVGLVDVSLIYGREKPSEGIEKD